jgi:hypothetical protein
LYHHSSTNLLPKHSFAGRAEDAVKIIRQLITASAGQFISIARLKIDPVWGPIRDNPDFQKLIAGPEPETVYK